MKKLSAKLLMALLLIIFTATTISATDWGLFDLKGKVKSVTYTNGSCPYYWYDTTGNEVSVVSFSKDGKVTPPKGNKIIRNKKGHITDIQFLAENIDDGNMYWESQNIRRDSKERLTHLERAGHESFEEYNHYYNEKGYVYKSVKTGNVVEDEYKETITYTYDSYDDYGNWTKRTCKLVGKLTSGGGGYYGHSEKRTYTETRKITYHDGAKKVKNTTTKKTKKTTKSTDSKKSKDSKKSSSSKSKSSKTSKK